MSVQPVSAPSKPLRCLLSTAYLSALDAWKRKERLERKRQRLSRIRLHTPWFRVVWVAFFLLRVVLFVYLTGLTLAYWFMSTVIFAGFRNLYDLPGSTTMLTISGLFSVGALMSGSQLVRMVRFSFKHRRLVFQPRQSVHAPVTHLTATRVSPSFLWHRVRSLYNSVLGPRGLLGIEHPYFFQLLVVRELAEITLQGYQAYTTSTHVPRRWMNHFVTALLVLNCWSTLLVHAFGPQSLAVQRVVCLAVDIVLDFSWTVVVPSCLVIPYAVAFDPAIHALPDRLQADKVWSLSWEMELQQVCVTSLLDLLSTLLPCTSMLMSTRTITGLIDEKRTVISPTAAPPSLSKQDARRDIHDLCRSLAPTVGDILQAAPPPGPLTVPISAVNSPTSRIESSAYASRSRSAARTRRIRVRVGSHFLLFFALGIAVLSVHVYAVVTGNRLNSDPGCLVQMRPWFTRQYACAYADIDCVAGRSGHPSDRADTGVVDSDRNEVADRLAAFHPSTLRYLRISHASALKVPAVLSRYSGLHLLEIYNATIDDWPIAAALTTHTHPHLRRFSLVRTNLSVLPEALARDAPFVFADLVATNLTTLPDSVHANWRAVQYITFEHGQLRELPRGIAAFQSLERLSLCDNLIETLPSGLSTTYGVLNVARNPLRALPETSGDTPRLRLLTFEFTRVATVPTWVENAVRARGTKLLFYGHESAYCSTAQQQHLANDASVVNCATQSLRVNGHFLLANVSLFE